MPNNPLTTPCAAAALLAALLIPAAHAAPPPPPVDAYVTGAGVMELGFTNGCAWGCTFHVGEVTFVESTDGARGGASPAYRSMLAQAGAMVGRARIGGGFAVGAIMTAGGKVSDHIFVDVPWLADGAWVPFKLSLSMGGEYSSLLRAGTAGGNAPYVAADMGVTSFGPPKILGVEAFGTSASAIDRGAVFDVGFFNRRWMPMEAYLNVTAITSGDNPVSIDVTTSLGLAPDLHAPLGRSLTSAFTLAEIGVYSASGHDYSLPVPEPATTALFFYGLALLAWFARRLQARRGA